MGNGKAATIYIIGGLTLTAIIFAVVLRYRATSTHGAPENLGQRLLAHSRDRDDYLFFVGIPPAHPTSWAEVVRIDESSVTLQDSQALDFSQVTAYFVAYPSGALVDYRGPDDMPMPAWVRLPEESAVADHDELSAADLQQGQSLVRVTFGKSTSEPDSRSHYSTTLTNVSGQRVRVLKFAGYTPVGQTFVLNTISRRFFTAEDFKEWYNQKGEWIEPRQSVTDPNNYGGPSSLWAYYCETQGGTKFLTGGIVE